MQCNAMQCNATQCNAKQFNAMQYNTIKYDTMQYTIQYNAMQYNTFAIQYNAMQCNTKYICNTIQCKAINTFNAIQYTIVCFICILMPLSYLNCLILHWLNSSCRYRMLKKRSFLSVHYIFRNCIKTSYLYLFYSTFSKLHPCSFVA